MSPLLIIALVFAVVVSDLVVRMYVMGKRVPAKHVGIARATYRAAPEPLWRTLTDFAGWTDWIGGKMERVAEDQDGRPVWVFTHRGSHIPGAVMESSFQDSRGRMVTRIADLSLPFGGSWTWEVEPAGAGGAQVSIPEDGEIRNTFFRFMPRYLFGYTGTAERFLQALAVKFGEQVLPETEWRHGS